MPDASATDANKQPGLRCPRCGAGRAFLRVRDTKHIDGAIKRYRKCRGLFKGKKCGKVVTTIEK